MNLNEIVKTLKELNDIIDDSGLVCSAKILTEIADELTPKSMDQKPEHEQWCLVFDKDGDSFIARYNAGLNSFHDDYWVKSSDSYKWLPAPVWKEDE